MCGVIRPGAPILSSERVPEIVNPHMSEVPRCLFLRVRLQLVCSALARALPGGVENLGHWATSIREHQVRVLAPHFFDHRTRHAIQDDETILGILDVGVRDDEDKRTKLRHLHFPVPTSVLLNKPRLQHSPKAAQRRVDRPRLGNTRSDRPRPAGQPALAEVV